MTQARPFLKWAGGKSTSVPELLKRVPIDHTYFEPFLGGGALFFALPVLHPRRAYLSDSNQRLISTYIAVRDYVEELILVLERHAEQHSQLHYARVREQMNAYEYVSLSALAAAMIYLNKTCFNGLYRENKAGEFNVPWGKHATFTPDVDNLRACSVALQGVHLEVLDFRQTEGLILGENVMRGRAVAYLDPPYVPVSASADFTSYTAAGFGPTDQIALRDMAAYLRREGVHVILSNADLPSVRTLYSGFNLESVQVRRNVNRDGKKRGAVGELIIT